MYFAMNKNASEKDQKATKQFLDYILNDDEARDIITNEAGFETPFKSYAKAGYQTKNPIHRANDAVCQADKYDIVIYPFAKHSVGVVRWATQCWNSAQETGTWDIRAMMHLWMVGRLNIRPLIERNRVSSNAQTGLGG